MLTNHPWDLVAFTWGQFHRNWWSSSSTSVWKLLIINGLSTVLSLTWESPYPGMTVLILIRGTESLYLTYCMSQHCLLLVSNIICHRNINTYPLIKTEVNMIWHYSHNVSLTICVHVVMQPLSCVRVDKVQSSFLRTHTYGTWFMIRLGRLVFPGAYYELIDSTKYIVPSNHGDHLHKVIVCP